MTLKASISFASKASASRVNMALCLGFVLGACRETTENSIQRGPIKSSAEVLPSNGIETTIPAGNSYTPKPSTETDKDVAGAQDSAIGPVPATPLVVPGDAPVAALPKPTPSAPAPVAPEGDATPTQAAKSVRNGRYYFKGVASGRCLDMPFGDVFGYPLILWDCTQSETQVFTLEHVADRYFKIFSPYLRVAEVRDGAATLGAVIQQGNGYVDGNYQQFEFELQIDKLTYMVRIHDSDLAWQVSGEATANGTVLVAGKASGSSHERFTLIPVP